MDKISALKKVWAGALGIARHALAMLSWVGGQLWDWTVLSFIVLALWSFGGLMASLVVAEAIPSAVELVGAAIMLCLGTVLLGLRVCFASWQSKELRHVAQRLSITILVFAAVGMSTTLGAKYLLRKNPNLSLNEAELKAAPPPPLFQTAPPKLLNSSSHTLPYRLTFLGIRIDPAHNAIQPPGILVIYRNNTGKPLRVQIKHIRGIMH